MRGVRLSPWSMSYFTVALVSLGLAEMVWASGLGNPLANIGSAWVLVGVHLTTIGFLTMVMLGALHQFVPVLTETELASQTWSGVTLMSVATGLLGMVLGFLALPQTVPGGVFSTVPWLLPSGGSLVIFGVVVALVNLGITLKRAWPWTLSGWLVATGLAYLLITVLVGLVLALSLATPGRFLPSQLNVLGGRGLSSHVLAGVGGWLTLTAMGVAYKLLAMFTLSDEQRGPLGWFAYVATAVGIFAVWLARWFGYNLLADIGWGSIVIGLAAYLWDMRQLYRERKRRELELNARYGVVPLMYLALLIVLGVFIRPGGSLERLDMSLVFMALYGWLGGLALTQLYKIVPFLTWLHQYGSLMGKKRTPRVQELVNEGRDRYAYWVHFIAVLIAGAGLALGSEWAFRLAMAAAWFATVDIARALYHAAHPDTDRLGELRSVPLKTR